MAQRPLLDGPDYPGDAQGRLIKRLTEGKAMDKTNRKKAKHGGHNPDNVLLGLHVTPEWKAIAKLTALMLEQDVTTVMLDGLKGKAAALGILDKQGKVAPAYIDEIEALAHTVRCNKIERQNNGY